MKQLHTISHNGTMFKVVSLVVLLSLFACGKKETVKASDPPTAEDIQPNLRAGTVSDVRCDRLKPDLFDCSFSLKLTDEDPPNQMSGKFEHLKDGTWRWNETR